MGGFGSAYARFEALDAGGKRYCGLRSADKPSKESRGHMILDTCSPRLAAVEQAVAHLDPEWPPHAIQHWAARPARLIYA